MLIANQLNSERKESIN